MRVKARPSLLLLHGWAMTPPVWQPLLAALDAQAFDVQAPALPGHDGNATRPDATLDAWAGALAPTIPPATTLVGWSLGALLALELARQQPGRVTRLILIGATPRFAAASGWPHGLDASTVTAFGDDYARQPETTLRRFLVLQTLGDAARRGLLPRLETACVPHPAGLPLPALVDGLKILSCSDLRPRLGDIEQPVHLIHGDGDALVPLAAARWLAATLPHARLRVLEHCGHAPLLSRVADLARFISLSIRTAP